jgi:hypothetical protein
MACELVLASSLVRELSMSRQKQHHNMQHILVLLGMQRCKCGPLLTCAAPCAAPEVAEVWGLLIRPPIGTHQASVTCRMYNTVIFWHVSHTTCWNL